MNKIIGSTRFYLSAKDSIKIGYTYLSPEYWGTGANKEIKKAMLDYAFEFVDKVYFDIGKKYTIKDCGWKVRGSVVG